MKVNNFDANGKLIDDLSKVVLDEETTNFIYGIFVKSLSKGA